MVDNKLVRQSSFELLRMICMLFIVTGHIICHAIWPYSASYVTAPMSEHFALSFIYGFISCGVNCFVLISGWFGIRLKWKSSINLYLQLAFYSFVLYLLYLTVFDGGQINRWCLLNTIMPISNNQEWWFIVSYVQLLLLSPLLNKAFDNMDKKDMLLVLLSLTVLNLYFGFYRKMEINKNGFNFFHFVFIYSIGRYLKSFCNFRMAKNSLRWICLSVYVVFSALMGYFVFLDVNDLYVSSSSILFGYYNNPIVLISSISFFILFTTFDFRSRIVNWMASSVLAVYLIHEYPKLKENLYVYLASVYDGIPNASFRLLLVFIMAVAILLSGILIDKIRILVTDPITNKVVGMIGSIQDRKKKNDNIG